MSWLQAWSQKGRLKGRRCMPQAPSSETREMKVGKGACGVVEREPIRYTALRIGDAGQKHVRHISFSFSGQTSRRSW